MAGARFNTLKDLVTYAKAHPGEVTYGTTGIGSEVAALKKTAADPEFQAKAASYFAPVRHLDPRAHAAELKETEAGFKQLWQVMPWGEK